MAVNAPVVEFYRLVEDTSNPSTASDCHLTFENESTPATLLDFGVIDAGSLIADGMYRSGYQGDEITTANPECQVFAIFNNKGTSATPSTTVSDMQNTVLSVVDKTGSENDFDTSVTPQVENMVYTRKWIQVLLNDEDTGTGTDPFTSLGKYRYDQGPLDDLNSDVTSNDSTLAAATASESTATKKFLHAVSFDVTTDPNKEGLIKGTGNDGQMNTAATKDNFAKIKVFPLPQANAAAGLHEFRLRVTYSYT